METEIRTIIDELEQKRIDACRAYRTTPNENNKAVIAEFNKAIASLLKIIEVRSAAPFSSR